LRAAPIGTGAIGVIRPAKVGADGLLVLDSPLDIVEKQYLDGRNSSGVGTRGRDVVAGLRVCVVLLLVSSSLELRNLASGPGPLGFERAAASSVDEPLRTQRNRASANAWLLLAKPTGSRTAATPGLG